MQMLVKAFLISSLSCFLFIPSTIHAADYEPQKVIYHINYDDYSRIAATFNNMNNHINEVGEDNLDLKAVIHGPAIKYFIEANEDEAKQTTLDSLKLYGVQFVICGNTLDGFQISYDDLYDVEPEDVVKAGLPEIVRLQQQGYFYVRP